MTDLVTTISQPASLQLVITPPIQTTTIITTGQGPAGRTGDKGDKGDANFLMIVVTASHVADKALTLPSSPTQEIILNIVGGTAQKQNVDFIVTADTISWSGLALELLLEEGDCLSIYYV